MRGIKKNKNKVGKHFTHLTPYPHPTRQSILLLLRKAVMSKAKCFINSRPRAIQPSQKKKKNTNPKKNFGFNDFYTTCGNSKVHYSVTVIFSPFYKVRIWAFAGRGVWKHWHLQTTGSPNSKRVPVGVLLKIKHVLKERRESGFWNGPGRSKKNWANYTTSHYHRSRLARSILSTTEAWKQFF